VKDDTLHFATKAVHSATSDPTTGAVMPPIYLASTFAQRYPGEPVSHYEYARTANPTRALLQEALAYLENGKYGICFSSGCAALNTLLQCLPKESHILVSDDVYGGTHRLLVNVFAKWGFTSTSVDMTNLAEVKHALHKKTHLIWLETPSNPLLKIIDISTIDALRQQLAPDAILAVDNTFATPALQKPLNWGADVVCHSSTKYLGGHSDVVGGALVLNHPDLAQNLYYLQNAVGAVQSAFDCYLLLRSLKTLALRMDKHCQNAQFLAERLTEHPKVKKVYYPGLETHPQFYLAQKQMNGFGGMISLELDLDEEATKNILARIKVFTLAESLGGVESLIEHPASMTHAAIPASHREKIGITGGLIRLSVGIEEANDLLASLYHAFE
jgi:cystathionine beta-lyase/cystathionine gamma-synthase